MTSRSNHSDVIDKMDREPRELAAAVNSFPARFKMKAWGGSIFRVNKESSYTGSNGTIQIVVEILVDETHRYYVGPGECWLGFARDDLAEVRRQVVAI